MCWQEVTRLNMVVNQFGCVRGADPDRDARPVRMTTDVVEGALGQLEKTSIIDKKLRDLIWCPTDSDAQEALSRTVIQELRE